MADQITKGYKVVAIHECGFVSSLLDQSELLGDSEWAVEYIPNEWTKPKIECSKLFAFGSLDDLYHFFGYIGNLNDRFAIFECEIKNGIFVSDELFNESSFETFESMWEYNYQNQIAMVGKSNSNMVYLKWSFNVPILLADEIMITKRIAYEQR